MKKSKKILLAAAGLCGTAAAAATAAYVTTKLLVGTALDREEPKIMKSSGKRISGAKDNELSREFAKDCLEASNRLARRELEYVEIVGADGTKLIGHFYPCENAERVVIAFHGWRTSWHYDYGMITDFWHSNGCSILYVEQRGQNNSGGDYMGFGLTERYDCVDWVNWAICRCGRTLPIYLAGISMGAATVLMASDLGLPDNVHGIMADCGFTSPKTIWEHIARNNLHIAYNLRSVIADFLCRQKIRVGSGDYSTTDALSKTDIPVLFIHGTDDKFVPVEMTYENYRACASPKRMLVVPGADHAMSYYIDRSEYEKAVLDFWYDFDGISRSEIREAAAAAAQAESGGAEHEQADSEGNKGSETEE